MNKQDFQDIRMLALDLDGTVLTKDKRLTRYTRETIEAAIRKGIEVVPVTGRPLAGLPESIRQIPGIRYAITSNGAVTLQLQTGEKHRQALISCEDAAAVMELVRKQNLLYNVFFEGYGFSDRETYEKIYDFFRGTALESYVQASRKICDDMPALIAKNESGAENIWIITNDAAQQEEMYQAIRNRWNLQVVRMAPYDLEMGNRRADKGMALSDLAGELGISKPEILAIGDSGNDLGMLKAAGVAVAMGNATEEVKKAADFITGSNEEDGAAQIIKFLI